MANPDIVAQGSSFKCIIAFPVVTVLMAETLRRVAPLRTPKTTLRRFFNQDCPDFSRASMKVSPRMRPGVAKRSGGKGKSEQCSPAVGSFIASRYWQKRRSEVPEFRAGAAFLTHHKMPLAFSLFKRVGNIKIYSHRARKKPQQGYRLI